MSARACPRQARREDLSALRELWLECFDVNDAYLDLYFARRFSPENTFVCDCRGKPAAMLAAFPLRLLTPGGELPVSYIYAVGTAAHARLQGLSTLLLGHAHDVLRERGFAAAVLVPAKPSLFSFYGARGYRDGPGLKELFLSVGELSAPPTGLAPCPPEEFFTLRETAFGAPGFFRWDAAALDYARRETAFGDGGLWRFEGPQGGGFALAARDGEELLVKELGLLPGFSPAAFYGALRALAAHYGVGACRVRLPRTAAWGGERPFAQYCALREDFSLPADAYFNLALD